MSKKTAPKKTALGKVNKLEPIGKTPQMANQSGSASKSRLKRSDIPKTISSETRLVHGRDVTPAWQFDRHLIPPMTTATTFRLESLERGAKGFESFGSAQSDETILIYDRLDEPNTMMLEEQLASLEQTDMAVAFGSGMGAISAALISNVKSGDEIVAHQVLYGCTYSLLTEWLPRFGIRTHFININSEKERKQAITAKTRIVYFESVTNPSLEIADLPTILKNVAELNRTRHEDRKILSIVDNTFATPWGLRPSKLGVDLVVESLTKNISGFGVEMGGSVAGASRFERQLKMARKDLGAIVNPKAAWHILVHGIPTLAIRSQKQRQNAQRVSEYLEHSSKIEKVVYPGLNSHPQFDLAQRLLHTPDGEFSPGSMVAFIVKGNKDTCSRFVNHIAKNSYCITLAVSLGHTKTLIEVPGLMTHSAIPAAEQKHSGIDPRLIRLSLGIESADDIIEDIEKALAAIY